MFGYNTLNSRMKLSTFRNYFNTFNNPGYISGNWYIPYDSATSVTGQGGLTAVTTTGFFPFWVWQSVTISQLGCRVTTVGTNAKLGIYANNSSTMKPTGVCLGSTSNIDVTATGNKSAPLSGGNLVLNPGIYWFAWGADNTATRFQGFSETCSPFTNFVGTTTQGRVVAASGVSDRIWNVTEAAYGTFGDMTAASITVNPIGSPHICFKVA